jgi:hypothetical protein
VTTERITSDRFPTGAFIYVLLFMYYLFMYLFAALSKPVMGASSLLGPFRFEDAHVL